MVIGSIGFIWGVVAAFQKSTTWGCVSLIFHPVGVIAFLVMTWRDNYTPLILLFLAAVGGIITILLMQVMV
jgi:hypothetical protein